MIPLTRHPVVAVDDLPWVILSEFDEQPGLRLTFRQVQRLYGLSEHECENALGFLTTIGLLVRNDHQQYQRPSSSTEGTPFRRNAQLVSRQFAR
jgi:hypothetical protein